MFLSHEHVVSMIACDLDSALGYIRELAPRRKLRGRDLMRACEAVGRAEQQLDYDLSWWTVEGRAMGTRAKRMVETVRAIVWERAGEGEPWKSTDFYGLYFSGTEAIAKRHVQFRASWRQSLIRRAA